MTMTKTEESLVSIGFKFLSIWDEGDTSSPLLHQSRKVLNATTTTGTQSPTYQSPTRQHPSGLTTTTSRPNRKKSTIGEYEYKNARDALVGSIAAVINFLSTSGVPKPACDQLQKNLDLGRYFAVMNRVQDYVQCISSQSQDETLARIHLAITAWEALCRFKTVEYKRAYKAAFSLRYELKGTQQEIKQAIALQVKLAEHCTACQKKLYLVQAWQRRMLSRMHRSTMIEPQGYQPIRCR